MIIFEGIFLAISIMSVYALLTDPIPTKPMATRRR